MLGNATGAGRRGSGTLASPAAAGVRLRGTRRPHLLLGDLCCHGRLQVGDHGAHACETGAVGGPGLRVWGGEGVRRRRRRRSKGGGTGPGQPSPPPPRAPGRFATLTAACVSACRRSASSIAGDCRRWAAPCSPRPGGPRLCNARTSQANHLLQLRAQRAALLQQPAQLFCCPHSLVDCCTGGPGAVGGGRSGTPQGLEGGWPITNALLSVAPPTTATVPRQSGCFCKPAATLINPCPAQGRHSPPTIQGFREAPNKPGASGQPGAAGA